MKLQGVELDNNYVERVVMLNEIIQNRNGTILVGPTMTGKSKAIKLLEDCFNILQK
jgi:Tfp pilus assembly pilus retraction ATPase PilT